MLSVFLDGCDNYTHKSWSGYSCIKKSSLLFAR